MEISDICMLRYKAQNAKRKLEDIHTRMQRIGVEDEEVLEEIYNWIKTLGEKYPDEEDMLEDADADALDNSIQTINQYLNAHMGI